MTNSTSVFSSLYPSLSLLTDDTEAACKHTCIGSSCLSFPFPFLFLSLIFLFLFFFVTFFTSLFFPFYIYIILKNREVNFIVHGWLLHNRIFIIKILYNFWYWALGSSCLSFPFPFLFLSLFFFISLLLFLVLLLFLSHILFLIIYHFLYLSNCEVSLTEIAECYITEFYL